ncbi:hypothetical protein KO527_05505 [Pseudoalteromonas sp. C2R02]|uniref:hypothetical protein n=1 Tax=Pseudoalteromonas sp. C2R02 TaxID=2841565 RepID=UPI001C08DADD|nr:hypothetical protein [Pseudoalteromonas sp. C2R02]MBU2968805.1 hypothetical protein [Pseudoalteromonas sp. C2R02]
MSLSFSQKRKLQKQLAESQKTLKAGGLKFMQIRTIQKSIKSLRESLGIGVGIGNQADLNKLTPAKFKKAVEALKLPLKQLKVSVNAYISENANLLKNTEEGYN